MSVRLSLIAMFTGSLLLTGCGRSLCHRDSPPRGYGSGGPGYTIPPQNLPDSPPPPLPPVPRARSNSGGAELLLPESMGPAAKSKSEYFDSSSAAPSAPPPKAKESINPDPPVSAILKPQKPIAVGIAGFAKVKDGVSTGLRPEIEGLDWLKSKGYKTVVYLRTPTDDDTTDRRQAEKRELKFVSWEITPEGFGKAFVDEFNQLIGDTEARPVFVYARDGNFAASVWYLHLRTAEFLTHEEARLRASQLGLVNEQNEYFRAAVKHLTP
ncbi:fused DSP-PTPase phosphatase/NAD kinase-like protein [Zavarzinella formosa]|uniref:fused DSP-PTPase phosphatase/NAD kinase-like protein n=1 Tax=Zavarzinella formosa TaxID=360055 RepID=UPI0002D58C5B|nr:hypothetical protein [Zavarzinella formosa]